MRFKLNKDLLRTFKVAFVRWYYLYAAPKLLNMIPMFKKNKTT